MIGFYHPLAKTRRVKVWRQTSGGSLKKITAIDRNQQGGIFVRATVKKYVATKNNRKRSQYAREIDNLIKGSTLHQLNCTIQFIRLMRNLPH
jgi:hypothetical protein